MRNGRYKFAKVQKCTAFEKKLLNNSILPASPTSALVKVHLILGEILTRSKLLFLAPGGFPFNEVPPEHLADPADDDDDNEVVDSTLLLLLGQVRVFSVGAATALLLLGTGSSPVRLPDEEDIFGLLARLTLFLGRDWWLHLVCTTVYSEI